MCIDQLKSDLLMHYFIGDIYDKKVIKEMSRTYGVSVKYIMKKYSNSYIKYMLKKLNN